MKTHQMKDNKLIQPIFMRIKKMLPAMILLLLIGSLTARADIRSDMDNSQLSLVVVIQNALESGMNVGSIVAEMIAAGPSQANSIIATAIVVTPAQYEEIILGAINAGVAPEEVVTAVLIASDGENAEAVISVVVSASPASSRGSIVNAAVRAMPATSSGPQAAGGGNAIPEFPAKPPRPSASYQLKNAQLLNFTWDDVAEPLDLPSNLRFSGSCEEMGDACPVLTLGVIGARLQAALEVAEYEQEYSFYKYRDDGFALVTSVEHIEDDGHSFDPKEFVPHPAGSFSLLQALQSIIRLESEADTATFRMLVFLASANPLKFSDETLTALDARNFVDNGYSAMPEPVAVMPFTARHRVHVLSYQFERTAFRVSLKTDRAIPASTQIERLGLVSTLAEKEDFEEMDFRPGRNCDFSEAFGIPAMEIGEGDLPGLSMTADIPKPETWQKNFKKTFPTRVSQTYWSAENTEDSEARAILQGTYCLMVQCADAERTKRFADHQIGVLKKQLRRASPDDDAAQRLTDTEALLQAVEANLEMCQRVLGYLEDLR